MFTNALSIWLPSSFNIVSLQPLDWYFQSSFFSYQLCSHRAISMVWESMLQIGGWTWTTPSCLCSREIFLQTLSMMWAFAGSWGFQLSMMSMQTVEDDDLSMMMMTCQDDDDLSGWWWPVRMMMTCQDDDVSWGWWPVNDVNADSWGFQNKPLQSVNDFDFTYPVA